MADSVAATISVAALIVSSITAWLTLFRRGSVQMIRPTVIYFGPDAPRSSGDTPLPKVYLRSLLFSTSKRGRIVESMQVRLTRNETSQNFNVWVYGDDKLVRGSGLFVGENGVAANHHFLTPKDGNGFRFVEGIYTIQVFAKLLGDADPLRLLSQNLEVNVEIASALKQPGTGLYFDWGPDSKKYIPHVENRPPVPGPDEFLSKLLGIAPPPSSSSSDAKD